MTSEQAHSPPLDETQQRLVYRAKIILDNCNHNDRALATLFVDEYGEQIRFVEKWKCWLVWDGRRWERDESSKRVLGLAASFVNGLWEVWPEIAAACDDKQIKNNFKFIIHCNNVTGIEAMLKLAAADWRVLISHERLNCDPMLLNLLNGTFDLRDDSFRAHHPDDLITQIAAVAYDPGADCPQWEETFQIIFGEDAGMIRYVKQVLGYALNGVVAEAILPIAYGDGCNGKSTIWNTVLELMGDYATVANETLLLGDKNKHETEKASLYQRRMVAVSEPPENVPMKESRVKELTGGDTITCRKLYENEWTFKPTHTFWMSTNHLPMISGRDEGIWRRIYPLPFTTNIREKVTPKENFHQWLIDNELPGILNWMIAGHRDWSANKFVVPEVVEKSRTNYRQQEDALASFIADCCDVGDHCMGTADSLFDAYKTWGGDMNKTQFGRMLGERFRKEKPTAGSFRRKVIYHGIAVELP